jgi:GGDEF domain-containing protein
MSIGVAHWQVSSPVNADALVRHADEAMYEAKTRSGRHVILRQPRCQSAA